MSFFQALTLKIHKAFLKEERTRGLVVNIFNSLFVKGFSVAAAFMLVPVSLAYVNEEDYGLWLTISSVITLAGLFDLGLSNGLKNKLTESYANEDKELAKIYLSTTYTLLVLIIAVLWLLFIYVSGLVNWQSLFNTNLESEVLKLSIRLVFTSFCLQFVLQPITALLMAKQKHYLVTAMQLCGNALALFIILMFGQFFESAAFLFLAVVLSLSYPLSLLLFSIYLFSGTFKAVIPTLSSVKFRYSISLFDLGIKFFIIQAAVLVMYYSNNLLISHLMNNENVTIYNIAFKYFSIIKILHAIVVLPLWTAFTDAYVLQDYTWIRKIVRRVNLISVGLCIMLIFMCLCSSIVYEIWIGSTIFIPMELNILLAFSIGIGLFSETYVMFINGTGKIKWQMYYYIIASLLHVPFAIFLVKSLGLGLSGIVLTNVVWAVISLVLWYGQYKFMISKKPQKTAYHQLSPITS